MSISNGESWIALAIIATSILTAWFMNYRVPKVRAMGTLLAALGCFAVVLWFAGILGTGIFENPKPNQTPMDSAKPALLWIQAAVALIGGLMLLRAALQQNRSTEPLELSSENQPDRYGFVSRMLHWTTLNTPGLFAASLLSNIAVESTAISNCPTPDIGCQ